MKKLLLEDAFEEGRSAYYNGVDVGDNPYEPEDEDDYSDWNDGYLDAQDSEEDEEEINESINIKKIIKEEKELIGNILNDESLFSRYSYFSNLIHELDTYSPSRGELDKIDNSREKNTVHELISNISKDVKLLLNALDRVKHGMKIRPQPR